MLKRLLHYLVAFTFQFEAKALEIQTSRQGMVVLCSIITAIRKALQTITINIRTTRRLGIATRNDINEQTVHTRLRDQTLHGRRQRAERQTL